MVPFERRHRSRARRGIHRTIPAWPYGLRARIQPFSSALAIEITSPSNTFDELARKTVNISMRLPSRLDFRYAMREVHVYRATSHPAILAAGDLLEDAALLPGFSARVEELFVV